MIVTIMCGGYVEMTSQCHNQSSSSDATECNKEFSAMSCAPQPGGTFYDDSLRPKSFLRDEVDEFNRVLAELLESRQRPEPLSTGESYFACCLPWSEDDKVDLFQTAQRDCQQTNEHDVNSDLKAQNISDVWRHASVLDAQPYATHWTAELDDDDDDDYVDVADCTLLRIVEEGDFQLMPTSGNIHSLRDICTNDRFSEVCSASYTKHQAFFDMWFHSIHLMLSNTMTKSLLLHIGLCCIWYHTL